MSETRGSRRARRWARVIAVAGLLLALGGCAELKGSAPIQIRQAFLTDRIDRWREDKIVYMVRPEGMSLSTHLGLRSLKRFDASKLDRVYAYLAVDNNTGSVSVEWVRPDGKIFDKRSFYFEGEAGYMDRGRAWTTAVQTKNARAFPGRWETKIYINGALKETLPWTLDAESPPELSSKRPTSYRLAAAATASKLKTEITSSGEDQAFEKGDGKRLIYAGRFDGLEDWTYHAVRMELYRPDGKHYSTYTQIRTPSLNGLWAGKILKLDDRFESHHPSGLWKVKFFVNGHFIDTLYFALHKKGEDPAPFLRLIPVKMPEVISPVER